MLKIFMCLHPSVYLLVSWAWWDWPLTWLSNIVLQCYDTVGWVMWPVKSSLKWPIMCWGDVKLYYTIPYQLSDQAKLLNDSIFVPPAAIYSLFYSFSLIRTAVAPSLSLDQRHGTSSKTICVSRTCKLTVFVVHWRRVFLISSRHIERIRGAFGNDALYKLTHFTRPQVPSFTGMKCNIKHLGQLTHSAPDLILCKDRSTKHCVTWGGQQKSSCTMLRRPWRWMC